LKAATPNKPTPQPPSTTTAPAPPSSSDPEEAGRACSLAPLADLEFDLVLALGWTDLIRAFAVADGAAERAEAAGDETGTLLARR
jgi:hypothetical protein